MKAEIIVRHGYVTDTQRARRKAEKWLRIADFMAQELSKDQSTKVGCIILDREWGMLSSGYNGPPRGVSDHNPERHQRPEKYHWAAHAEENAIAQAARKGTSLEGAQLVVTGLYPCTACARMIIQAGIVKVWVLAPEGERAERWKEQAERTVQMFSEGGVDLTVIVPTP